MEKNCWKQFEKKCEVAQREKWSLDYFHSIRRKKEFDCEQYDLNFTCSHEILEKMFKIEIACRNYSVYPLKNKSFIVALCKIFFSLHFGNSLDFFLIQLVRLNLLYNTETMNLKNRKE